MRVAGKRLFRLALVSTVMMCGGGCNRDPTTVRGRTVGNLRLEDGARELFVDVAADVGLDFLYFNGHSGELFMQEIMGAGCALFDFDNDGDLDIYLVQGHRLERDYDPGREMAAEGLASIHHDRLFRNDLVVSREGSRVLRFTDVTVSSGIVGIEYGMGVAVGDYNNDGWVDLYVTNAGPNKLWRNNCDGTFSDVTAESETEEREWSTSAAFVDFDGDGWLDLYVVNYIHYGLFNHRTCRHPSSAREYCGPRTYPAVSDRLFRNNGDGTFSDVSDDSGISAVASAGLGVVTGDFNGDGITDLYIANDSYDNNLWIHRGAWTFVDEGLIAGCAVNNVGERGASMGVDAGDVDGDGDLDLIVGNMDGETNTLFANLGGGIFDDQTLKAGLAAPSRRHTSYGTVLLDSDADGWLDLFVANGAMQIFNQWNRNATGDPLVEPNQLFLNLGDGSFVDMSDDGGPALALPEVSRGACVGDIDNDGDVDVLVTNNDGSIRLLMNSSNTGDLWYGFDAVGTPGGRTMLGSLAVFILADGRQYVNRIATDGSYCSARDARVAVSSRVVGVEPTVRIAWPDGVSEDFRLTSPGTYVTLIQGAGVVAPEGGRIGMIGRNLAEP